MNIDDLTYSDEQSELELGDEYEPIKKNSGSAFDTELINSTIPIHANEVLFYTSKEFADGFIRGIPISVDPDMIKIQLTKFFTDDAQKGQELWLNKKYIIACHIVRDL